MHGYKDQDVKERLAKVTGDYVVLLSADDLLAPGSLSRATALMEAHPSIGFAYGHVETFSVEPPRVAREAVLDRLG